jgi:1-acyl-sn-glycerol-3-phosphate acyltransferase
VGIWVLLVVLLPLTVPVALVVDSVRWSMQRRPFMATRLLLFGLAYSTFETLGVIALGLTWVGSGFGHLDRVGEAATIRVQGWWAASVFSAVERVFRLEFRAKGLDAVAPGPYVLLARHASIIDNLLPAHFISAPHGVEIGYVMKSELLVDPCLDIAGNRLPNAFVRRSGGDSDSEVNAIRALGTTMAARSGAVLIYPEGTRFSERKLTSRVQRLTSKNTPLGDIAAGYRRVLPPRPAGALALLESTAADVVVMAHRGLDGFARVADIWRGAMVGRSVDVEFWRIARSDIPGHRSDQAVWLFKQWAEIDRWILEADMRVGRGAEPGKAT